MPDGLYDQDILAWSIQQADLLRRLERGEQVNDVDWANVVEEIEDVGRSELQAVQSYLRLMITHLLKLHDLPEGDVSDHWRNEIANFQIEAVSRFTSSMRRRLDIDQIYGLAIRQLRTAGATLSPSPVNPFALDHLLSDDIGILLSRLPVKS